MSATRRLKHISTVVILTFSFSLVFLGDAGGSTRRESSPKATIRYVVRRGDTLYSIARRYGTTVER
ncbi:MAG: LysM peptidoglycan-binding domain-containing protein, partial [bacterium]